MTDRRGLTSQQRRVLRGVATGHSTKQIAADLQLTERTVKWHMARIFERLGAANRAEAVAIAIRRGDLNGSPSESGGTNRLET
ncbi:MAG TPA: helix-turn-helix transcriptional regulator [Candidatus Limnocylindria bacterium]|nr:helix-turn-helix transcriptional regulator [Candidatus Limnocylindria bacterium]